MLPRRESCGGYDPGLVRLLLWGLGIVVLALTATVFLVHKLRPADTLVDLGEVYEPPDSSPPTDWRTSYHWRTTSMYSLSLDFGLAPALANRLSPSLIPGQTKHDFECVGRRELSLAYRQPLAYSMGHLSTLADRLRQAAQDHGWNVKELVEVVVALAQASDYHDPVDLGEPTGLFLGPVTLARGEGDCDSKSLLIIALLRDLGIDATMLVSETGKHAMLAIDVPFPGRHIILKGRRWALVEATGHDPAGVLKSDAMAESDWTVLNLSNVEPRLADGAPEALDKASGL
mgnify:CR=1 FL=1